MGEEKKTEEQLREEITTEFNFEADDERIDKILQIKKDRYSATQAKKKAKKDVEKTKTHFKTQAQEAEKKAKEAKTSKEDKPLISSEDKAYLFGKLEMTRTEIRHLEKVMKLTDKGWEKALQDSAYTSWKTENDKLIKRRGSQLGASRGGSSVAKGTVEAQVVEEFSKDLPTGLAKKSKK